MIYFLYNCAERNGAPDPLATMAGETSRTFLGISEREDTVRSFFEKPCVSIYTVVYGDLSQKYREKKAQATDTWPDSPHIETS